MLIVKKMDLVERGSRNLPVRLLVQIAESHGIGKQLVQLFGHLQPYGFLEFKRQRMRDCAIRLNLAGTLMEARLWADLGRVLGDVIFHHSSSPVFSAPRCARAAR